MEESLKSKWRVYVSTYFLHMHEAEQQVGAEQDCQNCKQQLKNGRLSMFFLALRLIYESSEMVSGELIFRQLTNIEVF